MCWLIAQCVHTKVVSFRVVSFRFLSFMCANPPAPAPPPHGCSLCLRTDRLVDEYQVKLVVSFCVAIPILYYRLVLFRFVSCCFVDLLFSGFVLFRLECMTDTNQSSNAGFGAPSTSHCVLFAQEKMQRSMDALGTRLTDEIRIMGLRHVHENISSSAKTPNALGVVFALVHITVESTWVWSHIELSIFTWSYKYRISRCANACTAMMVVHVAYLFARDDPCIIACGGLDLPEQCDDGEYLEWRVFVSNVTVAPNATPLMHE